MELYDHPFSPYACKVRGVLYEKNAPHEKREMLKKEQHAALARINPRAEVPALVVDGRAICDSKVICAYLEERFPEPTVYGRDPVTRARVRYLELKSDNEIDPLILVLGFLKLTWPQLAKDHPEALPKTEQILRQHYAWLERELGHGEWFGGDFVSVADIALTPHLRAAQFMGYPAGPEHPRLAAWMSRCAARPSLKRAMREYAQGFASSQQPDSIFDLNRFHMRDARIEFAIRVGLGPWLLEELAKDRAFLSPIP
jgi:glutathione S-transferase